MTEKKQIEFKRGVPKANKKLISKLSTPDLIQLLLRNQMDILMTRRSYAARVKKEQRKSAGFFSLASLKKEKARILTQLTLRKKQRNR